MAASVLEYYYFFKALLWPSWPFLCLLGYNVVYMLNLLQGIKSSGHCLWLRILLFCPCLTKLQGTLQGLLASWQRLSGKPKWTVMCLANHFVIDFILGFKQSMKKNYHLSFVFKTEDSICDCWRPLSLMSNSQWCLVIQT